MADFLYFAYGSNMLTRRLMARTPSALPLGAAFVDGYRLTFDKVSKDGSGKCDIVATGVSADRVWGVLFRIPSTEAAALDQAEGRGYRKGELQAVTADIILPAVTYFAAETDPTRRPYHWYKTLVLVGAIEHGLPAAYVAAISDVISVQDPDADRRARNEALLKDGAP